MGLYILVYFNSIGGFILFVIFRYYYSFELNDCLLKCSVDEWLV